MSRQYYQIGKAYRVRNKEGQVFKLALDLSSEELKKMGYVGLYKKEEKL